MVFETGHENCHFEWIISWIPTTAKKTKINVIKTVVAKKAIAKKNPAVKKVKAAASKTAKKASGVKRSKATASPKTQKASKDVLGQNHN